MDARVRVYEASGRRHFPYLPTSMETRSDSDNISTKFKVIGKLCAKSGASEDGVLQRKRRRKDGSTFGVRLWTLKTRRRRMEKYAMSVSNRETAANEEEDVPEDG